MHVGMGARAGAVAALTMMLVGASTGAARPDGARPDLFARLSGSWVGSGTAGVAGAGGQRVQCRADFVPAGPAVLRLSLRCASGGFGIHVEGRVARDGTRVVGSWTETIMGVSGDLSGEVRADALRARVAGMGLSAMLSIAMRGGVQAVSLASQGQFAAGASLTLRRV